MAFSRNKSTGSSWDASTIVKGKQFGSSVFLIEAIHLFHNYCQLSSKAGCIKVAELSERAFTSQRPDERMEVLKLGDHPTGNLSGT